MRTAAVSNRSEIMTSKLALKKSQDPKVRRIAQMLVTEHSQALSDLKMLARLKQYSLPATTDAKNMAAYRKLSRMSGKSFDREYVLLQTRAHNAAVRLHREQMERANDSNVRSYAAKYYAPVFSHTEMIQEVAQAYNIPVAEREEGQPMNTNRASSASKQ
jgi:putative membrane protein